MSTYVPQIKGYIADVPKMWFRRCDGRVFHYDELTACNVTPSVDFMEVNTGWSSTPNAYLPGSGGITVDVTSAQFTPDIFAMANARNAQDADVVVPLRSPEDYTIPAYTIAWDDVGHTVTIDLVIPSTIDLSEYDLYASDHSIIQSNMHGIEELADYIASDSSLSVTSVTPRNNGFRIVLRYMKQTTPPVIDVSNCIIEYVNEIQSGKTIQIDNKSAAIGEVVLRWPVYNSGSDCTEAAIKGFQTLRIFRARVTTMPGMDDSYKEAGTYSLTLSGMDMKRSDGAIYKTAYAPATAEVSRIIWKTATGNPFTVEDATEESPMLFEISGLKGTDYIAPTGTPSPSGNKGTIPIYTVTVKDSNNATVGSTVINANETETYTLDLSNAATCNITGSTVSVNGIENAVTHVRGWQWTLIGQTNGIYYYRATINNQHRNLGGYVDCDSLDVQELSGLTLNTTAQQLYSQGMVNDCLGYAENSAYIVVSTNRASTAEQFRNAEPTASIAILYTAAGSKRSITMTGTPLNVRNNGMYTVTVTSNTAGATATFTNVTVRYPHEEVTIVHG